ncbi:hypothetical protein G7046_g2661 [Stylonectria norvegica]|nr:hypothetical protein G7046_g2661 [Stylonectria norvegica]
MRFSSIPILALFLGLGSAADEVKTVTVAAAIPSNEPQWKDEKTFTSAILNSTNFYRAEHNASDVTWNKTLEDFASDYLDDNGCKFEHSGGPYGENLAMGYPNATGSVEGWGNERDDYNFKKGGFGEDTGHFTQLVWKNTTTVGCGRKLCGEKGWFLVCEYWPRGNVEGEYQEEVQKEESVAAIEGPRLALVLTMAFGCALLWM